MSHNMSTLAQCPPAAWVVLKLFKNLVSYNVKCSGQLAEGMKLKTLLLWRDSDSKFLL